MEKYYNNGKEYNVESVTYFGAIINVNGTSITDCKLMGELNRSSFSINGYTVFCDSDEIYFDSFDKAYEFAMTKQKNTFRLATIEDMFMSLGVKQVFDQYGYFTDEAMEIYNRVAERYFGNNIDQLDKLCEEEKCFK